ncbi:MAG TPA: hypothetical protein VEF76_07465 [Patescibacteria group bacterium]|nr:hypothetical protein [Patescibacteria group bacterium]
MLDKLFKTAAERAIPANRLNYGDVAFVLGAPATGTTETKTVGNPLKGDYATYTIDNMTDGKTFTLDATISRDWQEYKTSLRAEWYSDTALTVTSLTFDNKPEKLDNPKEIFSVLNYIGVNHVRGVFFGGLPSPHEEKGDFSKFGRFLTRALPKPASGWPL